VADGELELCAGDEVKLGLIFVGLLALCGCSQTAQVLSKDGTKVAAVCEGGNWVLCMTTTCPNGYDVVSIDMRNSERAPQDANAIVRCK